MKKKFISALLIVGALTTPGAAALAEEEPMVIAPAPQTYSIIVNGKTVADNDYCAYVENKQLMAPLRLVAEQLGFKIKWNGDEKKVDMDDGIVNGTLYIGKDNYSMTSLIADGATGPLALGAAPEIVNDTTFVPIEFFRVLLGNHPDAVSVKDTVITIRKEKDGATDDEKGTFIEGVPSPFVDYKTVEEAKAAVKFDAAVPSKIPTGYELTYVGVISGETLHLDYTNKDKTITFRTAKGDVDISGDYNEYKSLSKIKVGNKDITVKGDGKTISNATWTNKEMTYAIYADNGIGEKELTAMIDSIK